MISMTRSKRQYGSGCLLKRGKGWAIRWRETEIAFDGTRKGKVVAQLKGYATSIGRSRRLIGIRHRTVVNR
jgi:hypothetical protein